jgi:hypothetical protein
MVLYIFSFINRKLPKSRRNLQPARKKIQFFTSAIFPYFWVQFSFSRAGFRIWLKVGIRKGPHHLLPDSFNGLVQVDVFDLDPDVDLVEFLHHFSSNVGSGKVIRIRINHHRYSPG